LISWRRRYRTGWFASDRLIFRPPRGNVSSSDLANPLPKAWRTYRSKRPRIESRWATRSCTPRTHDGKSRSGTAQHLTTTIIRRVARPVSRLQSDGSLRPAGRRRPAARSRIGLLPEGGSPWTSTSTGGYPVSSACVAASVAPLLTSIKIDARAASGRAGHSVTDWTRSRSVASVLGLRRNKSLTGFVQGVSEEFHNILGSD
jgi:hypothetical protein